MKEQPFKDQVDKGYRFKFGKNWSAFLSTLTEERIEIAKQSLVEMLECNNLTGKTFLDVGCGSGLFSLAAMKLGATTYSFDFDPTSVRCCQFLKAKYFPQEKWIIQEGSILNKEYINSLGKFDIVYSWGVLHHTGNLLLALENVDLAVKEGGKLLIAIYNDQGKISEYWKKIKRIYNASFIGRVFIISIHLPVFFLKGLLGDIANLKNPIKRYKEYKRNRGMSIYHDWMDWLGGLPFEVASPEFIFEYYKNKNYSLIKLKSTISSRNNQFVFLNVGEVSF